ncbi:pyoverdine/dityrosine biosynthesis family protein [Penicillium angulare]|uniref:pyoverdine/dityrosine biosynthesis family protein n=1 Tax=Penicillium angulare TaxID=116970 RepID=UPI00254233DD|nr:pyoverdine/dityrosine biosynthesis family protein [Penicillium angulare]KAJ5280942.1 pyoverdine/dityrosine biosynthesis family protein [Penicillium angulare]
MECIYDRVVAIYSRTYQGQLVRCFGTYATLLEEKWHTIQPSLGLHAPKSYRLVSGIQFDYPELQSNVVRAHEAPLPRGSRVIGVILLSEEPAPATTNFDEYFCRILIHHLTEPFLLHETSQSTDNSSVAERLVDLCNTELLVHPSDSLFETTGRNYLIQKISLFTSRGLPIRMCLPAFPCKSSNLEKVAGVLPDRGEELALRRLYSVLRQIKSIYDPGAKLCIISDGHVFSDCIGVDDDQVDEYGDKLLELNQMIGAQMGQTGQIIFKSLKDILNPSPKEILGESKARQITFPALNHYLDTTISPETEFCRQAMTLGCQPNREFLRSQIQSQDQAILSLYRGFSRFMLEDLAQHPRSQTMSKSQRKKTAEKSSFEMILRNQAYSNLVELCFPDYVRLSIHAHINSGPKFGIMLFERAKTRVIDDLHDLESIAKPSHDLLHIPTPWHNCVFQMTGSDIMYVTKSKVVRGALDSATVRGCWTQESLSNGLGGYFQIEGPGGVEKDAVASVLKPVAGSSVSEKDLESQKSIQKSKEGGRSCVTGIFGGIKRLAQVFKSPSQLYPKSENEKALEC